MPYQEPSDLNRVPEIRSLAKTETNAFLTFHAAVFRDGGAISRRNRELMGLAVGYATRCGYCIDTHTQGARAAGATREELAEAAFVAAAVSAGGTASHGLLSLKLQDDDGPNPVAVVPGDGVAPGPTDPAAGEQPAATGGEHAHP